VKKHLQIDLIFLPEEGKTFSGELDGSIFSAHGESIQTKGPLYYDLFVQKFDNELLIRGNLSASFVFTCDRCLNEFTQTIDAEEIGICPELSSSQLDLADSLREELVIRFPDYPHCDKGDDEQECNLDSRYLAVDKPPVDGVKTPPHEEEPNPWDALDAIEDSSSSESS